MSDETDRRSKTFATIQDLKVRIARLIGPLLNRSELTQLQACVLLFLAEADRPLTIKQISERSGILHANASSLCKKLEKDGYLSRQRGSYDQRTVLLSLTDKGKSAISSFQSGLDQYLGMLTEIPQETLQDLEKGMQAAHSVLDYLYEQFKAGRLGYADGTMPEETKL